MSKPKLAPTKSCTGCMACVDTCHKDALEGIIAKDEHLYVEWSKDKCVNCGLCSKVCPIVSEYNYEAKNRKSKPYAGWANNEEIRLKSASGGIFAAIAYLVINNGGYVVGATMDNLVVQHILINRIEDIPKLQGSKYQQGNLTGIYREVKKHLNLGHLILFSGTGCQIGGLYSYLGKLGKSDLLITIDFICSGFPSLLPLNKEVDFYHNRKIENITYTNKEQGWTNSKSLTLYDSNGNKLPIGWNKNIISSAFNSKLLHRNSCLNCSFCFANRQSDITLGDFWGDKEYPKEHFKGISIIIVHTDKGRILLEEADVSLKTTSWEKFLPFNFRMVYGKFCVARFHLLHTCGSYFFNKYSYTFLQKWLGNPWGTTFIHKLFYGCLIHFLFSNPMRRTVQKSIKENDIE